ncbi:hypothetical protein KVP09_00760 [Alcaligenaceae bacterium CGII-47]|nr:hypothetical protein [Alcaligenaceae bacterium CGII-47]
MLPPRYALLHRPLVTRQSGLGAAGFLLAALPILLLGLGGVELTHGLFVRQALSHALVEAGRAAIVDHAHPDTLVEAFEHALHPLFLQEGSLHRALAQRKRDTGRAPWQIRIVQPRRAAFVDHISSATNDRSSPSGWRTINHDYQALQHEQRLRQGWPEGRGPISGQTIFEANTLTLELIWPHEPLVPGIKALMRVLRPSDDSYRHHLMSHGYLPILRGVSLSMQSHPVAWPDRSDGKVIHGEISDILTGPAANCAGFWGGCAALAAQSVSERPTAPIKYGEGGEPRHDIDDNSGAVNEPSSSPGHKDEPSGEFNREADIEPRSDCDPAGCC